MIYKLRFGLRLLRLNIQGLHLKNIYIMKMILCICEHWTRNEEIQQIYFINYEIVKFCSKICIREGLIIFHFQHKIIVCDTLI